MSVYIASYYSDNTVESIKITASTHFHSVDSVNFLAISDFDFDFNRREYQVCVPLYHGKLDIGITEDLYDRNNS